MTKNHQKLVCIISALWGRTGSTTIFDSQTRYFRDLGYRVCRVFVEHWENHELRAQLIRENFEVIEPDYCLVATRRAQLRPWEASSSVGRLIEALAGAEPLNPEMFRRIADNTDIVVVNHTMHIGFAATHFTAPIILEAHDRLPELLEIHGVPDFAAGRPDSRGQREVEEIENLQKAAHCVALSKSDYAYFGAHHASVSYIRPHPLPVNLTGRDLRQFCADNGVSPPKSSKIDLLLWGDWHGGNKRSVAKFFKKTYPLLSNNITIGVAGRVCEVLPESIKTDANVHMFGRVDNLHDLIKLSEVAVLYDAEGSGTSIKTIDALCAGQAFAGTVSSLRDVDLREGFKPSKSYRRLAQDINKLLKSPQERENRRQFARELFVANFSYAAYRDAWNEVMLRVSSRIGEAHRRKACPKYSVIIATYDRYELLHAAIQSVLAQESDAIDYEIIVVDNFVEPESHLSLIERYRNEPRVKVIGELKKGLSNARNAGVAASSGDVCCFIDDDAVAHPSWLGEIARAFVEFGPETAVVGGSVQPQWKSPVPSWLEPKYYGNLSIVDWGGDLRVATDAEWFAGCNIAFRKSYLEAVGGFNSTLGRSGSGLILLSNEESDAADRIVKQGGLRVCAPQARVDHLIDPTRLSKNWLRKRIAWQAVSDYLMKPEKADQYARGSVHNVRTLISSQARRTFIDETEKGGLLRFMKRRSKLKEEYSPEPDISYPYDMVMSLLAGENTFDEDSN